MRREDDWKLAGRAGVYPGINSATDSIGTVLGDYTARKYRLRLLAVVEGVHPRDLGAADE